MEIKCSICNKIDNTENWCECDVRNYMQKHKVCFTCAIWLMHNEEENENVFILDNYDRFTGNLTNNKNRPFCVGFGGKSFYVKFDDGRICWYNNVWHQGTVPEKFRNYDKYKNLHPNAKLISEEEYFNELKVNLSKLTVEEHFNVITKDSTKYYDCIFKGNYFQYGCLKKKIELNDIGYYEKSK